MRALLTIGLLFVFYDSGAHAQLLVAGPRLESVETCIVSLRADDDLERLREAAFNVTNVSGSRAWVITTAGERERLSAAGFEYVIEPDPPKAEEKGVATYHSYATMTALLQSFASDFPEVARLVSLGQSGEGRELWALHISDNPDAEEDEPEFKYISTMHGDEPVGTEMCLLFIGKLLTGYASDERIARVVNETAISIVPLMNPDGLESNTRGNADGFDLNRSFPDYPGDYDDTIFDGEPLGAAGRPVEVQRIMEWTAENSFVLSANLHGGALLVNYPYDHEPGVPSGSEAISPDDALFKDVSLRYSMFNPPMFSSPVFEDGISNGSAWFAITGGMQDWNYRYLSSFDVTIELSNIKRPSASTIPDFWEDNEESMLSYLEAVHIGVRGVVTDRTTGEPVYARVRIEGNDQPVFTDPDVGDYHRLLLPDTYWLSVDAPGYITFRGDPVVTDGDATRIDIELSDGDVNLDGDVDAADVQTIIDAAIGRPTDCHCDVNGRGMSATDVQAVVNRAIVRE